LKFQNVFNSLTFFDQTLFSLFWCFARDAPSATVAPFGLLFLAEDEATKAINPGWVGNGINELVESMAVMLEHITSSSNDSDPHSALISMQNYSNTSKA